MKKSYVIITGILSLVLLILTFNYALKNAYDAITYEVLLNSRTNLQKGIKAYERGCSELLNWKSRNPISDFEKALQYFIMIEEKEAQTDYEIAKMHTALIYAFLRISKQNRKYSVTARNILENLQDSSKSIRIKNQCILIHNQVNKLDKYYFKSIVDMDGQMEKMISDMSAFMKEYDWYLEGHLLNE